jgi:hypothetical protein
MSTTRASLEWRARVRAEYHSAAITAQLVQWMIVCGLPDELLRTGLRVVHDELDHARLSHEVVCAIGDDAAPEPVDLAAMCPPTSALGIGASLIDGVLRNLCVGETLAVPLFAAMRDRATVPAARAALERIVRDEAVHSQLGWDALDALIALDALGTRQHGSALVPILEAEVRRSYVDLPAHTPLTEAERALGMLEGREYAAIVERSLRDTIRPRLARRGLLP